MHYASSRSHPSYHEAFDMNRDGVINAVDLGFAASHWGRC
jgi:hypothetical protein